MVHAFSLDIVICTYNNAALLRQALRALSIQRVGSPHIEWRVVVVNNNCTDATADVVGECAASSAVPLRMIHETRQGLTYARASGVASTSGDWIAFVDDDCVLADDWIEQTARFASAHPRCGAFGSRITLEWEQTPPRFVMNRRYAYAGKPLGDTARRRTWLAGAGMVVRRKALEECGWVEKPMLADRIGDHLVSGGDVEIGLRIAQDYEVWYNPACNLRHLIPARRMSPEYLRRMEFGLGASRHHVAALTWRGTYLSWLAYSIVYGTGFVLLGVVESVSEAVRAGGRLDLRLGVSPARGWCAAMLSMWRMNSVERHRMLGAAAAGHKRGDLGRAGISKLSA